MRTMRLAGAIALFCGAGWIATPAAGSSAHPLMEGSSQLRGSISISSAGSSYALPLILLKTVTVVEGKDTHVDPTGGRFAGYILRKDGPGLQPAATDFRANGCLNEGCRARFDLGKYDWALVGGDPDPQQPQSWWRVTLPAGRYHLVVIADGAPMHGSLRLRGLSGRLAINSGQSFNHYEITQPEPSVFNPPTDSASPGHLYSAGSSHRGARAGYLFFLQYKLMRGWDGTNQAQICGFAGPPDPNAAGPYEYPCATPQNAGGAVFAVRDVPFELHGGYQVDDAGPAGLVPHYLLPELTFGFWDLPGRVGSIGGFINSGSPAVEVRTQTLWVDFSGSLGDGKPWHQRPPS